MNINEYLGINSFGKKEDGTEMPHEEKYTAIVNAIGLKNCISYIPATKEEIQEALKTDEHLNNIPIKLWDREHAYFKREFLRIGINVLSISGTVCTLKRAARMWAEMEEKENA